MRTAYALITILLLLLSLFPAAYALPTTGAATDVTSNNLTFHMTGAVDPVWWKYGTVSGNLMWVTENTTSIGGVAETTEGGVPLMAGTTFYYAACDSTGCGAEMSAALPAVTPNPETTYGRTAHNISVSHFDPIQMSESVVEPYTWSTGTPTILFGVLLLFVFTGLWLRQREVILPTLLGLIGSGMLIYQGTNSVGIPPEFLLIAIGVVCAGLTGVVLGLIKR